MFRNFKNETITIKHIFSFKWESKTTFTVGLLEILLTDAQFWSAFEPITWANSLYFKRFALLKKCMSNLSHLDDKKFDIYWIKGFASYSLIWKASICLVWWPFFSQMLSNLCIVRLLWAKPLVSCSVWVSMSPLTSLWILMCLLHKYAKTISVQQLWSIAAQTITGLG